MVKREIIEINEKKCNGCGMCVPNCQEGALQIIDGKARLISDLFCDGLGACIKHCPQEAIKITKREAIPYNERKVMEKNIVPKGENTIKAHIKHLKDHNATEYLKEAISYLKEKGIDNPLKEEESRKKEFCSCPGAMTLDFSKEKETENCDHPITESCLRQWPVQLHLVNPNAPYYQKKDILIAADCTAYAYANFHRDFLSNRSIAIACPKLDEDQETYVQKLVTMIDEAKINSMTVAVMEVPCCSGLLNLAKEARSNAKRNVPIKSIIVSLKGEIIKEEWI